MPALTQSTPKPISDDPVFWYGLTMGGDFGAAQIRDQYVAFFLKDDVERSTEKDTPAVIHADDARRLRDLLNIATARGML